uniref:Multidrug resistance protein MdtH n=1 Tax=Anthurium amnicola TaxID=1678845 RepID=A0A1D1ZK42_9ARAE
MISISISTPKHRAPFFSGARTGRSPPAPAFLRFRRPIPVSSLQQNPGRGGSPSSAGGSTVPSQVPFFQSQTRPVQNPIPELYPQKRKKRSCNTSVGGHVESQQQMWVLCRFGYWVQGFRCFPWLALNLHLVHGLGLSPSTLQLVQNISNVPMVAKPFCGLLSDALYIGGARRLPYISCGVFLQVMSWGTLCLIPITGDTFPTQMACILLGNLGASFTEVVSDALVAEFSKAQKEGILQSYAFMALAAGGILGNLSGGFVLLRAQQPKFMFFTFALLLIIQLGLSLTAKEDTFYMPSNSNLEFMHCSMLESLSKRFSDLVTSINEESICHPLSWIVASIAVVPLLSGTIFCSRHSS